MTAAFFDNLMVIAKHYITALNQERALHVKLHIQYNHGWIIEIVYWAQAKGPLCKVTVNIICLKIENIVELC